MLFGRWTPTVSGWVPTSSSLSKCAELWVLTILRKKLIKRGDTVGQTFGSSFGQKLRKTSRKLIGTVEFLWRGRGKHETYWLNKQGCTFPWLRLHKQQCCDLKGLVCQIWLEFWFYYYFSGKHVKKCVYSQYNKTITPSPDTHRQWLFTFYPTLKTALIYTRVHVDPF